METFEGIPELPDVEDRVRNWDSAHWNNLSTSGFGQAAPQQASPSSSDSGAAKFKDIKAAFRHVISDSKSTEGRSSEFERPLSSETRTTRDSLPSPRASTTRASEPETDHFDKGFSVGSLEAPDGMTLTCPMTGNATRLQRNPPEHVTTNVPPGRLASGMRGPSGLPTPPRMASLRRIGSSRSFRSAGGAMTHMQRQPSFSQRSAAASKLDMRAQSRASRETSGHDSRSTNRRKGGGGIISHAEAQKRRDRKTRSQTRAPPFSQEDVKLHAPIVEKTWNKIIETVGVYELGTLLHSCVFNIEPELQHLFDTDQKCGGTFVNMISVMVKDCHSPSILHEKNESLGKMHSRKGVKPEHMPKLGQVIFAVLLEALQDEFTQEVQDAWGWLWSWTTKSMTTVLNAHTTVAALVTMSWDLAMDNASEEEIGGALFDRILVLAPHLQEMFARPRQMLALRFVNMINLLVSFADDPEKMKEQVLWLGTKHAKFGAKQTQISVMGEAMVDVLSTTVGEEWTEEMENAWLDLWNQACSLMFQSAEEGEKYGPQVEAFWNSVMKKGDASLLGEHIVHYFEKHNPELVDILSADLLERTESSKAGAKSLKKSMSMDNFIILEQTKEGSHGKGSASESGGGGVISSVAGWFKSAKGGKKSKGLGNSRSSSAQKDKDGKNSGGNGHLNASFAGSNTSQVDDLDFERTTSAQAPRRAHAVESWGNEMWEALKVAMKSLWALEEINEPFIVVATRLQQAGFRTTHLEALGYACHYSMRKILENPCEECGTDDWSDELTEAWKWLWDVLTTFLHKTVYALEQKYNDVVRDSWEIVKATSTSEEIGETMYSRLGEEAPFVLHLFTRPKNLQAYMFMQAIDMLVMFSDAPTDFFKALQTLTIRHIKYGVKSDYLKPFGIAILGGIEALLGDRWDENVQVAWLNLWKRVTVCISKSLNCGANLVALALITGHLDKIEEAFTLAPRSERIQWALALEMQGNRMSPIYWALRDGRFNIAQFLIKDVLSIRADRTKYYYGRAELFKTHPNLIEILCDECPALVGAVLDGLMWHSQSVEAGAIRTNYYIQELYGNPDDVPDAWKSALAVLCLKGKPEMFMHPVTNFLLESKYHAFGKPVFFVIVGSHLIQLALFTMGFILSAQVCSETDNAIRLASGIIAILVFVLMTLLMGHQAANGQHVPYNIGIQIQMPRLLENPWNMARYLSVIGIIICSFYAECKDAEPIPSEERAMMVEHEQLRKLGCAGPSLQQYDADTIVVSWVDVVLSFTAILMWGQVMQIVVINKHLAALTYSVSVLLGDITRNLVVIGMILVSVAAGMNSLEEPYFEEGFGKSIMILLRLVLGIGGPPILDGITSLGRFIVTAFVIVTTIGLLSILIAQLALSYEMVSKEKIGYARMNKAYVCVEAESFLPLSKRKQFYNKQGFDNPLLFDEGDLGPAGGIQTMEAASVRAHEKYVPDRIVRAVGQANENDPWPVTAQLEGVQDDPQVT